MPSLLCDSQVSGNPRSPVPRLGWPCLCCHLPPVYSCGDERRIPYPDLATHWPFSRRMKWNKETFPKLDLKCVNVGVASGHVPPVALGSKGNWSTETRDKALISSQAEVWYLPEAQLQAHSSFYLTFSENLHFPYLFSSGDFCPMQPRDH